MVQDDTN